MQTIYIDTYLCVNMFVDYLMLVFVRKVLHINSKHIRLIPASIISSLSSLCVFLPIYTKLIAIIFRITLSVIIVFIAYGKTNFKKFIIRVITLIATSVAYSGIITLICLYLKPVGITIHNGAVYFNISPITLVVCTIISFITLSFYEKFRNKNKVGVRVKNVTVISDNKQYSFKSQVDTGMNVKEPFSGLPVIIAEKELIDKYPEDNIRIIPYKTLSGEGALTAFKPEKVIIDGKEVIKGCYVAVCDGRLNGEIKSLIGNDVSEG